MSLVYKPNKEFIIHPQQFTRDLCKSMDVVDGKRIYITDNDKHFPSITTILAATMTQDKKNILGDWEKRIGKEEADKVKTEAAERGTILHDLMELYLFGQDYREKLAQQTPKNQRLFNQFINVLDKNVNNIRMLEKPLYSSDLKIAGRVDMIAEYNGKLSVIDFKTSTRSKSMQDITDYWIQETFYAICYMQHFKEPIQQIVTIIGTERSIKPFVYIDSPKNYLTKLIERVNIFYKQERDKQ